MCRGLLLLAALIVAGLSAADARQPRTKAAKHVPPSIDEIIDRDAMVAFVAEGPPNSCGLGCSRWIAAEGSFNSGSAQRVIKLLNEHKDLPLPIYFHSKGGLLSEALEIGRALRKLKMKAGVGRTSIRRCAGHATSNDCRRFINSGRYQSAQLRPSEGICASACVYAFLGARSRTVDSRARVGVHATRPTNKARANVEPKRLSKHLAELRKQAERETWQYISEMGADPGLLDFAAKVHPSTIRILARAELIRFGVVSTDGFETPWLGRNETPNTAYSLLKILTTKSPGDRTVYLSTQLGLTCYRSDRVTVFIERELLPGENGNEPLIRVLSDGKVTWASTNGDNKRPDTDYRAHIMSFDEVLKAVPKRSFELALDYAAPEWMTRSTTIKLSIAGLETALTKMRRQCERIHGAVPKTESMLKVAQRSPSPEVDRSADNRCPNCETPWIGFDRGPRSRIGSHAGTLQPNSFHSTPVCADG